MRSMLGRGLAALWVAAAATALGLSCNSGTPACTPANCNGCCDSAGACLGFDKQAFASCGGNATACHACVPGEVCASGACIPDPNGGGQDSGNGGGQDSGNGGQDSGSTCAFQGFPCCPTATPCIGGLACVQGICQPAGDGGAGLPVGSACTAGSQCATGTCGTNGFPGGYCTQGCTTNANCPASTCGTNPAGGGHLCLEPCTQAGTTLGCRIGYVCEKKGTTLDNSAVCFPACTSGASCPTGQCVGGFCCGIDSYACCNGTCQAGAACGADHYCHAVSGQDAGAADSGTTSDAGSGSGNTATGGACAQNGDCTGGECVSGWPGGYCTQACNNGGGACPGNASCSPFLQYPAGQDSCYENCTWNGGQSTCRNGYVCDREWIMVGLNSPAVCIRGCQTTNDCLGLNASGCESGFCCGYFNLRCCAGSQCPNGGSCQSDDYCR